MSNESKFKCFAPLFVWLFLNCWQLLSLIIITYKVRRGCENDWKYDIPGSLKYVDHVLVIFWAVQLLSSVHVFQIDNKKGEEPVGYLKLPPTQEELEKNIVLVNNRQPIQSGALSWNQSDHFQVSTLICSTKLTHNGQYRKSFIMISIWIL